MSEAKVAESKVKMFNALAHIGARLVFTFSSKDAKQKYSNGRLFGAHKKDFYERVAIALPYIDLPNDFRHYCEYGAPDEHKDWELKEFSQKELVRIAEFVLSKVKNSSEELILEAFCHFFGINFTKIDCTKYNNDIWQRESMTISAIATQPYDVVYTIKIDPIKIVQMLTTTQLEVRTIRNSLND